jgi:hypothetical protein
VTEKRAAVPNYGVLRAVVSGVVMQSNINFLVSGDGEMPFGIMETFTVRNLWGKQGKEIFISG